mmetsp:Transcript_15565/g.37093  ORF Transcript_15565/g.37093 Transcript_15565/m.37093 type:complete len:124 (+) Transcript_15565:1156-1527(+)
MTEVFLLGEESLAFLIPPGKTTIHLPSNFLSSTCGLLPLGNESRSVHTEGFRWNIRGSSLSMTSQLSSSNQVQTTPVEVTTTEPLLWYSEVLDKKMDEPSPEKTPISEASPITRRMATLPPKL